LGKRLSFTQNFSPLYHIIQHIASISKIFGMICMRGSVPLARLARKGCLASTVQPAQWAPLVRKGCLASTARKAPLALLARKGCLASTARKAPLAPLVRKGCLASTVQPAQWARLARWVPLVRRAPVF